MTSTDFFDQINTAIQLKRPFVLFSKPESHSLKAYVQANTKTHTINNYSESGFVFAPFDAAKDSYYIPLEDSIVIELENLDFEKAALYRDEIRKVKKDFLGVNQT